MPYTTKSDIVFPEGEYDGQQSKDFDNAQMLYGKLAVNVEEIDPGTSLVFTVYELTPESGIIDPIIASEVVSSAGHFVMQWGPALPTVANRSANVVTPRAYRIVADISGGGFATYTAVLKRSGT
jgi:hypothetical protein